MCVCLQLVAKEEAYCPVDPEGCVDSEGCGKHRYSIDMFHLLEDTFQKILHEAVEKKSAEESTEQSKVPCSLARWLYGMLPVWLRTYPCLQPKPLPVAATVCAVCQVVLACTPRILNSCAAGEWSQTSMYMQ